MRPADRSICARPDIPQDAVTAILRDPNAATRIDPAVIPALLVQLAAAQAVLSARLVVSSNSRGASAPEPAGPVNLGIKDAARRLGVSASYLYRHAKEYPFTVRIGRRLLFREAGIARWLDRQGEHGNIQRY